MRPRDMTIEILTCRESGHYLPYTAAERERFREYMWDEQGHTKAPRDLVRVTRTCQCCKSVRVDVIDEHTLALVRRHYRLVDGYSSDPGSGRVTRNNVRRELFRRLD